MAKAFAGSKNFHEMKELLHALHKAYEAGKDLVESIGEDEGK